MTDYMKEAERLPELHREIVDDALEVVDTFGPWGMDVNEDLRRQIVLADEVRQLRKLYSAAVKGRQDMRTALQDTRAALKAALTPSAGSAEAERLVEEYGDAVSDVVGFAQDPAGYSRRVGATRAALLAHIQRGAPVATHGPGCEVTAGVPMPKPVAYGFGNTAITGHTNRLMMVRIDIPGGDQYAGAFWLPLVLADEAHAYGVACRAAGEAAGYARGLRDAVRDADIEALRLYVRALCKAVDAATDFAGTVAGGASWWDDVWADHAAALDRARERISQAALRGEVKT